MNLLLSYRNYAEAEINKGKEVYVVARIRAVEWAFSIKSSLVISSKLVELLRRFRKKKIEELVHT